MDLKDIELLAPVSRGSTAIFKTGQWGSGKPGYREKTSPCRQACPAGIDMARALAAAALGRFDEALRIVREDNPLPGVCGRVCYHPCERACNRKDFDEAVNIRGFERYLSDHGRVDLEQEVPDKLKEERVAIVGSGPAGLSAAWQLARWGYPVTIFEARPEPGGMLRYGIPEYRLPKAVLGQEIALIRQLGVEIRTGVQVGSHVPLQQIKKDHQALLLAAGVQGAGRLGVVGEDRTGVLEGITFLKRSNAGEPLEVGRRVAVIGGGNTAMDCARTARRLGGEEVTVIYRRSRVELPALDEEVAALETEGIRLLLQTAPKRILAEGGRLAGLECLKMDLGVLDDSGRPRPMPIDGSEFVVPVDTVIQAVGQIPEAGFTAEIGLITTESGLIRIDPESRATNLEGVFAAGDLAGERAFVADAIAGGKGAALALACYLEGRDFQKEQERLRIGSGPALAFGPFRSLKKDSVDLRKVVPFEKINLLCFAPADRRSNPERPPADHRPRTFSEVTVGLDPATANWEISRCFKCGTCIHCDLCFLLCPDVSIHKHGRDGYWVDPDYCKGCGQCAATCPRQVIEMRGPA
jgi:NADPH-dependent glutamate synthase beta subunit-like oxidoreductase